MRRAASTDENQPEIVETFRRLGASVQPLHGVGQGCPDLLVGILGFNWLVEVKDGMKPPSKRTLTPDQKDWHANWKGQKIVIESVDQAIAFVRHARLIAEQLSPLSTELSTGG